MGRGRTKMAAVKRKTAHALDTGDASVRWLGRKERRSWPLLHILLSNVRNVMVRNVVVRRGSGFGLHLSNCSRLSRRKHHV